MFDFTNALTKTSDAFSSMTGALGEAVDDMKYKAKSKIDDFTYERTRMKDVAQETSPFKTEFKLGDPADYFKPSTEFGGSSFSDNFAQDSAPVDAGAIGAYSKANTELMANDGKYKATTEFGGATDKKDGPDWEAFSRMLQSIKPNDDKLSAPGRGGGGGFRFDRKPYENPLLTREYGELYNQPLYNKLV